MVLNFTVLLSEDCVTMNLSVAPSSIDTITESEDSPIYLKWFTPPKYLEARMVDEEDDDDMRAGKFKSEGASL